MTTKPRPVYMVDDDGKVVATASVHRPPGRMSSLWSWRVSTKADDGKRKWHPLGRHAEEDVPNALVELIAAQYPGRIRSDGSSIRTLDAWAAWVETRQACRRTRFSPNRATTMRAPPACHGRQTLTPRQLLRLASGASVGSCLPSPGRTPGTAQPPRASPNRWGGCARDPRGPRMM